MKPLSFVLLLLLGTPLLAATAGGRQQYILLLRQPNASAAASIMADVDQAGGSVDAQGDDRIMIALPDPAVAAMRGHAGVKYLQRATVGPQPVKTAAGVSASPSGLTPESQRMRLQPAPMWDSSGYVYDGVGNITGIGTSTYGYDALSRLTSTSLPGHSENYTYDPFGNMTQRTTDNVTLPTPIDVNNHLSGLVYDTAGNLTQNGAEQYLYDPFSNMREKDANSTAELYVYDANDERIGVRSGPDHWLWSLRDENGQVLRQYESFQSNPGLGWTWVEDYVYRDGALLGAERVPEEGGRRHFHLDHLGTPRLITGTSGQIVASHDYFPFGNELPGLMTQETSQGFSREEPMKFTGHERDFTSGTAFENTNYFDYMHARHGNPGFGRFLSVDPAIGDPQQPQSWNRYAYVLNNPIKYTDPDGLFWRELWNFFAGDETLPQSSTCYECMFYGVTPDVTVTAKAPGAIDRFLSPVPPEQNFVSGYLNWAHGVGDPVANVLNGACGRSVQCGMPVVGSLSGFTAATTETTALVSTSSVISDHAAMQMTARGVTRGMIDRALTTGTRFYDPKNGSIVYVIRGGMASGKDLAVAVNPFTRSVNTVMVNFGAVRGRFIPLN